MNIEKRIRGTLFGQAIGDALGLATEFMSKADIVKYYPAGVSDYSQIIEDQHRIRWKKGMWTDDTDQMLCILDSLLEKQAVDINLIAEKLLQWLKNGGMGVGGTVAKVLSHPQYIQFPHQASHLCWKLTNKQSASNGGIMRTSILGIWEYWNEQKVIDNTEKVCRVTHYDPRCVGSCVIITYIISAMFRNEEVELKKIEHLAKTYDPRIMEYIELSLNPDISKLRLDDEIEMGYTLKTLSAALWAYFNAK